MCKPFVVQVEIALGQSKEKALANQDGYDDIHYTF